MFAHRPARAKFFRLGGDLSRRRFDIIDNAAAHGPHTASAAFVSRPRFRSSTAREGDQFMRLTFLLILLLAAGCENLRGPLAPRSPTRIDDPSLSIAEQQVLGRDRIGAPDNSWVLPPEAGARPGR
jgi:hypothetical protein